MPQNISNNGRSPFGQLGSYLDQISSSISRVNRATGRSIRKQDSDLFQTHADGGNSRIEQLVNEIQRTTGVIDEDTFLGKKNKIESKQQNKASKNNDGLFHLSQKQLWSSFAREITKSLKRNI